MRGPPWRNLLIIMALLTRGASYEPGGRWARYANRLIARLVRNFTVTRPSYGTEKSRALTTTSQHRQTAPGTGSKWQDRLFDCALQGIGLALVIPFTIWDGCIVWHLVPRLFDLMERDVLKVWCGQVLNGETHAHGAEHYSGG
jgi:hypothetical protein